MERLLQLPLLVLRARPTQIVLRLTVLGLVWLALVGLSILPDQAPSSPQPKTKHPRSSITQAMPQLVGRTAHAAELEGEMDFVADGIFGQPDFVSGSAPDTPAGTNLNQPGNLFVFDLTGQIFIADTLHNRVLGWESVDFYLDGDPANVVLGQPDFETSDALDPPTAASMNGPVDVTMGFDGLLYVSDTGNNRVLVFFPINYGDDDFIPGESYPEFEDGQEADYILGQPDEISNTALPTGPDTLNSPMGLVTDANDNLVVADSGNNRVLIYEWDQGSGTIGPNAAWVIGQEIKPTSLEIFSSNDAPNPPTRRSMNRPTGVAADTLGREVSVADTGNNRILVFTSDPLDNQADFVLGQPDFVSNSPNNGGLSATSLDGPTGLKMDAGSRLFVADSNNHRVLVFDRTRPANVTAGAVFGQPGFNSGIANNGDISASTLDTPTGIATDSLFMDVYIADAGNNRVLQFYQPLDNPFPIIGELDPGTVRAGSDGFTLEIWGSGIISDTIVEINGVDRGTGSNFLGLTEVDIAASEIITTGQLTVTLRNPAPGGGVSAPVTFAIYAPAPGDDQADSILGQRGFTTNDGPFAPVMANSLYDPAGAVVDPASGRLFVSDLGNARVLSWPSSQAQIDGAPADLVIGKPDFTTYFYNVENGRNLIRPVGLALDSQGNLYVADADADLVAIYTPPFSNGTPSTLLIQGLNNPIALGLDSQDNLYVADSFNHRVLFYEKPLSSKDTTPDRVFGQPDMSSTAPNAGGAINAATLNYPSGLALDSADNLYVSDSGNHRVLVYLHPAGGDTTADIVFGQQGAFTTGTANKGGLSAESLNYPYGLGIDVAGSLWVADSDNNRVLRFDAPLTSDGAADFVLGQNGSFARSLSVPDQPIGPATLRRPAALAATPGGDLFVADTDNSRVLGFQGVQGTTVESKIYLPGVRK